MKRISEWRFKDVLALVSTFGVLTLLGVLQLKPIPETNKDIVNIALGTLLGGLVTRIAGHYYPSAPAPKTDKDPLTDKQ